MNEEEYSEGIWRGINQPPVYRLDFKVGDGSWFTIPNAQVESFSTETASETLSDLVGRAPAGREIEQVCDRLKEKLLRKNISYGNSALAPIRIFSKADTDEQINVRIDDKLNRIANGEGYPGDNDLDDILGYLVLLKVSQIINA